MSKQDFVAISAEDLKDVSGGGFWGDLGNAAYGAVKIVTSPVSSAYTGVKETVQAMQAGHNFGDSLASGLVQAAGGMGGAPKLSQIKAK